MNEYQDDNHLDKHKEESLSGSVFQSILWCLGIYACIHIILYILCLFWGYAGTILFLHAVVGFHYVFLPYIILFFTLAIAITTWVRQKRQKKVKKVNQ